MVIKMQHLLGIQNYKMLMHLLVCLRLKWVVGNLISSSLTGEAIGDCDAKLDSVFKVEDGANSDSESEDIVQSTAVDDTEESPDEDEDSAKD